LVKKKGTQNFKTILIQFIFFNQGYIEKIALKYLNMLDFCNPISESEKIIVIEFCVCFLFFLLSNIFTKNVTHRIKDMFHKKRAWRTKKKTQ